MGWNINFDGKTKLKDWWGVVRDNFVYLKKLITDIDNSIGMRIAEARGINPTKHIVESAEDKSGWLITDHYLVPVPTTDGKVVYEEYAYADGGWVNVGMSSATTFTAEVEVLDSGWTLENEMHTQSIECEDLLSTDNPIVDVCMGDSLQENKLFAEAWEHIIRVVANDGSVTLYTDGAMPSVGFTMLVKVVR